jgi:parallel beta-helix repeat protein
VPQLATIAIACAVATRGDAAVIIVPDDQPTIQAAVTVAVAGDTVQVRPATYPEGVRIENGQTGLTLEGLGGRPVLTPPTGTNGILVDEVNGVTIRGLEIQGGVRGVRLDTSAGGTLTDLLVSGQSRDGILVRNGSGNTVSDSSVTGAFVDGIRVERCDAAVVTGNTVSGSGRRGIQVKTGATTTVTDNVVDTSGRDGLEVLRMTTSAVVTGNASNASGRVGFRVKTLTNATIAGNSATGAGREGVIAYKVVGGTFDGNVGDGNVRSGIRVRRCASLAVTDNQANGNGEYGFWVQATPPIATPADLMASGNTASGNALGDFRVDP